MVFWLPINAGLQERSRGSFSNPFFFQCSGEMKGMAPRMKARDHEMCSVRSQRMVPRAKASIPPRELCIKYRATESRAGVPRVHGGFEIRHGSPLGVVQDTVVRKPSRGTGPALGAPWVVGQLALITTTFAPRVSLLGICWPERSNGSIRRSQPPSHPEIESRPGAANAKTPACTSARKSPALPRNFITRLLHACAN
jgi:hypothetical protein